MHTSRPDRSLRTVSAATLVSFMLISSPAAHAEVTLDGTLGPGGPLAGPDYAISDDLGQQRGANLFHSFGDFTINTGESATFTGPTSVENILGRVTGGNASLIDGRLSSQIPGANLYLMNPSGLMFGPNASLDISGSFHATTADYIGLADGGRFDATTPSNSVLTAAPPEAFGFLGDNPRPLELDGSELVVADDQTISLVGGDITIIGNASDNEAVRSPGGRINIVSVASPGEVPRETESNAVGPELDAFERLGSISLTEGASVSASSEHGGSIFIRGGRFTADAANVFAAVRAPTDGQSNIKGERIGIDIETRGEVKLTNESEIATNVVSEGRADSGGIRLKADEVNLSGGAQINSVVFGAQTLDDGTDLPPGIGNSGDIEILATKVSVREGSVVRASTGGEGDAGDIGIDTTALTVDSASIISAAFGDDSGNTGHVSVSADTVKLSGEPTADSFANIQTTTRTTGVGGDIHIEAREVQLEGRAQISTDTRGDGPGGDIEVTAERIAIEGASDSFWGIFANTFSGGTGGSVRFTAKTLEISERGSVQTQGLGTGPAGSIAIEADSFELRDGAFITASGWFGEGVADAGDIDITVGQLSITGFPNSEDPFGQDATGVFSGAKEGTGGTIQIRAEESVTLNNGASVQASSTGSGPAGDIELQAPQVELRDGSNIISNSFGAGSGGEIAVKTESLNITGVYPERITIRGEPSVASSGLFTQTLGTEGSGGDILVQANSVEVLDGARIDSSTVGAGNGGSVEITADRVLVAGASESIRALFVDQGFDTVTAEVTSGAGISSSSAQTAGGTEATGDGGRIQIAARSIELRDRGFLFSGTTASGAGGEINVVAENVQLSDGGRISAESLLEGGNAGNIAITAADSFRANAGAVRTATDSTDGGNIQLTAQNLVYLLDSEITTSVGSGTGKGGNITIDPQFVVLNRSDISANAFGGPGGNILIVADNFLASADSTVTASSEFGVDGDVVIRSPEDTVIVGVEALPESFLDVSSLLRERCAARTEAEVGSFVVLGRGGVPPGPDGALSSSDVDIDTQTDAKSASTADSREAERSVARKGQRLLSGDQPMNSIMPVRLVFSCGD